MNTTTHLRALALTATAAVALSACGNSTPSAGSSKTSTPSSTTATAPVGSNEKEAATVNPRVLLSHDQGLTLLDAETGKTLKETKKPGFLRLSNAGDGRHVMVSDADVFRVFDMGISSQPHGDHKHNYTYEPGLAERTNLDDLPNAAGAQPLGRLPERAAQLDPNTFRNNASKWVHL